MKNQNVEDRLSKKIKVKLRHKNLPCIKKI